MKLLVFSWRFLILPGISANENGKVRGDGLVWGSKRAFQGCFRLGARTQLQAAKERLTLIHDSNRVC